MKTPITYIDVWESVVKRKEFNLFSLYVWLLSPVIPKGHSTCIKFQALEEMASISKNMSFLENSNCFQRFFKITKSCSEMPVPITWWFLFCFVWSSLKSILVIALKIYFVSQVKLEMFQLRKKITGSLFSDWVVMNSTWFGGLFTLRKDVSSLSLSLLCRIPTFSL